MWHRMRMQVATGYFIHSDVTQNENASCNWILHTQWCDTEWECKLQLDTSYTVMWHRMRMQVATRYFIHSDVTQNENASYNWILHTQWCDTEWECKLQLDTSYTVTWHRMRMQVATRYFIHSDVTQNENASCNWILHTQWCDTEWECKLQLGTSYTVMWHRMRMQIATRYFIHSDVTQNANASCNWIIHSFIHCNVTPNKKYKLNLSFFFFSWTGFYSSFENISLIWSRSFIKGGRKQENLWKNHLTIRKQNLVFPHVTWGRL